MSEEFFIPRKNDNLAIANIFTAVTQNIRTMVL